MALSKQDQRGLHMRTKFDEGRGPTPWTNNMAWVDQRKSFEDDFKTYLRTHGLICKLPWTQPQPGRANVGNAAKCLFMHLKRLSFEKKIVLTTSDTTSSFFGITEIVVPEEHRKEFDEGPFPTISSMVGYKNRKRVAKQWHTVGMEEIGNKPNGAAKFIYSAELFVKIKKQHKRSDIFKSNAGETMSSGDISIPTGSVSGSAQVCVPLQQATSAAATNSAAVSAPVAAVSLPLSTPVVPFPPVSSYNMPYANMYHAQPSMMMMTPPVVMAYTPPVPAPVPLGSFIPPAAPVMMQPRVATFTTPINALIQAAEEERQKMAKRQKLYENIRGAREAIRVLQESIRNDERALAELQ